MAMTATPGATGSNRMKAAPWNEPRAEEPNPAPAYPDGILPHYLTKVDPDAAAAAVDAAGAASVPVNVDVPHAAQDGMTLTCTMGNWNGEPTAYAYQWQRDGADIGGDAAMYPVTEDDVGRSFACVVTASNDAGSATAPASNSVVVVGG